MSRPTRLSKDRVESELKDLPGWSLEWPAESPSVESPSVESSADESSAAGSSVEKSALVREFRFRNFTVAFGFMASVATVAEKMDHHPDWSNSYNRVTVRLSTHDAGGVTSLDIELARKMSELAAPLTLRPESSPEWLGTECSN